MIKNIVNNFLAKNWWVYLVSLAFIALNAYWIKKEIMLVNAIPFALIVVFLAIFKIDILLLALMFFVPLSVPLSEFFYGSPIDMFLPTEPIMAGILLIFIFKIIMEGGIDVRFLKHPVSLVIYAYLAWILVTSISSTMPLVSVKFFISKVWFIVTFYFIASQVMLKKQLINRYFSLYMFGLILVIMYTFARHAIYGVFEEKIAHWACNPFYKDHTSYGAILAFYIPIAIAFVVNKQMEKWKRVFYFSLSVLFIAALIMSFSRAAWLSLFAAFGTFIIIKFQIKFRYILLGILGLVFVLAISGNKVLYSLNKNNQDSSNNLSDHLKSITNVSSDASNLERINRWNCAIQMFKQKPVLGWGPATYMFQYAPFQLSTQKTIISTNEGRVGNAHSEYLGPLAEQGLPGVLLFVILIVVTIRTAIRAIRNTNNRWMKVLAYGAITGLITYYLHGFLNNFLDTDKISAPFWGFTAFLVIVDLYYSGNNTGQEIQDQISD